MSKQSNSTSSGGVGLLGALFLLFLALKLIGVAPVATWSWWWVTAPLWGGVALAGGALLAIAGVAGVAALIDGRKRKAIRAARSKRQ